MKIKRFAIPVLCVSMMMSLMTGCGKEENRREEPTEQNTEGAVVPDPVANEEDFYGCWEYAEYDEYIYFYTDGTYESFDVDGNSTGTGTYTFDGEYMNFDDMDLSFAFDDAGDLIDNEGDLLFASELPVVEAMPYFDEYSIPISAYPDGSEYTNTAIMMTTQADTDGGNYAYNQSAITATLEYQNDLGNGYIERKYTITHGIKNGTEPTGYAFNASYWDSIFDYTTGYFLPINSAYQMSDGSYYYEVETPDGIVDLTVVKNTTVTNHVGDYTTLFTTELTVTAPNWYTGFVFSVLSLPGNYAEYQSMSDTLDNMTTLEEVLDLPVDILNSMNYFLF